ncbi:MAG: hypothetical protein PHD30_05320 [Paludibacter sp.]|nr:hypothetical protein [Paludibacter sp.]
MRLSLKHKLPLTTLVYVEDTYNTYLNLDIQSNYNEIISLLKTKGINFIYLPFLRGDANFKEKLKYNHPYMKAALGEDILSEMYAGLKKQLQNPLAGEALISIMDKVDATPFVSSYPLDKEQPIFTQLQQKISIICSTCFENFDEGEMYILYDGEIMQYERGVIPDEKKWGGELLFSITEPQRDNQINADDEFDKEAYQLAYHIKEKIKQLQETGAIKLLSGILEEVLFVEKKLSAIFITRDYQIFLKDYEMKEVVMPPLSKAIFLLFLQHPEGIYFKNLSDYHDELLSIYKKLTVHEDIRRSMQSIKALTNPLDNSINEKCSRIRAAFLEVIADDLAKYYYITGKRGEAKKILLDRSLVVFQ